MYFAIVQLLFQSTRSGGSATNRDFLSYKTYGVSIHALRGKRDENKELQIDSIEVSIHALRGKRDDDVDVDKPLEKVVSIHALRGKRDLR